jgi:hypothetical protein
VERLRVHSKVSVPDDVREMVELATHTDHLEARARVYGERWIPLWHRLYGNAIAETQQAIAGLVDRTRDYSAALINERVQTRLGDGSVDVEVDGRLISPDRGADDQCPRNENDEEWCSRREIGMHGSHRVHRQRWNVSTARPDCLR